MDVEVEVENKTEPAQNKYRNTQAKKDISF